MKLTEMAFVENKGQFDPKVKFQVSASRRALWLTQNGIVFDFQRCNSTDAVALQADLQKSNNFGHKSPYSITRSPVCGMERNVISQDFLGASKTVVEPRRVQPGERNYLTGNDPTKWQTRVRGFSEVLYHDVWQGVDIRLYGKGADLEQEFIVNAGADSKQVQVAYKGIEKLEVRKDGSLLIRAAGGEMRESRPRIYQEIRGQRVPIKGRFRLLSATSYTFDIPAHNEKYPLVIDPTLLYSTFLGGSAGNNIFTTGTRETATGIAVDQSGNAYVTGFTQSPDFPTTPGVFQTTSGGGQETFVSKLNPAGSTLIYSTYLNASFPTSIAVDAAGNAYIAGSNAHAGFPTTANAYNPTCDANGGSAFLTVLNSSGSAPIYSTCFASNAPNGGAPVVSSVATDAQGHAYVSGLVGLGSTLPTTPNAYQPIYPGSLSSGFVMEFDTTLSGTASLLYSTYLGIVGPFDGGHPGTTASAVAVDSFGKIYLTGFTADGFPVTPGAFQTVHAPCSPSGGLCPTSTNAFIAKLDPTASGQESLIYGTYFGGIGFTGTNAIAVDGSGNAYITGASQSALPTTPGSFQSTPPFGTPAAGSASSVGFITKLNAGGSQLVYSTYLVNPCIPGIACFGQNATINGIALDGLGNAFVTGSAGVNGVPVTPDAFQSTVAKASGDFAMAFVSKINATGADLVYSSLLGGQGDDAGAAIAVDQAGDAYVVGRTASLNFPVSVGALQPSMNGTGDAFITKFPLGAAPKLAISSVSPAVGGNVGIVTARIVGGGFHSGATIKLVGANIIVGSSASVGSEGRTIDVPFDLTGATAGAYSVSVTNPDGSSISFPDAFTVQEGGGSQLSVNIVGRNSLVIEQGSASTTFNVVISNTGNTDALGVVLSLYGIPSDASLIPLFQIGAVPVVPGQTPIDFSQLPLASVLGQEQIPHLLLPVITPGATMSFPFALTISSLTPLTPLQPPPPGFKPFPPPITGPAINITALLSIIDKYCTSDNCLGKALLGLPPPFDEIIDVKDCIQSGICVYLTSVLAAGTRNPIPLEKAIAQLLLNCGKVAADAFKLKAIQVALTVIQSVLTCGGAASGATATQNVNVSKDPNDKEGIIGAGAASWVKGSQSLFYSVYFSNEPTATAAARTVLITDPLDASIDLSTFNMSGIVIGEKNVLLSPTIVPAFGQLQAKSTLDYRPAQSLIVNADVSLDPSTRTLTWQFTAIDPKTGISPSDPSVGVLPPGVEGSISYSAKPLQTLVTGTVISNQASVVFDGNGATNTPTWANSIDNTAPVSQIAALASSESMAGFTLAWSGTDVGSGIQDFTIFVSDNGGPFTPFQTNTTATSALFTGQVGHTYGFYSIARDLVGNVEANKTAAEATTQVALVSDSTPPTTSALAAPAPNEAGWNNSNVTVSLSSADDPGGTGLKQITYSETGSQPIVSTAITCASTSFLISTEGITTVAFFGTDNAGNTETPKTLTVQLDKTPPSIKGARTPTPNANGWNNTNVTVSFACVDAVSGLAPGSPPGNTVISGEGINQSVSGACQDLAGNTASATLSGINIDKTAPTISGMPAAGCVFTETGKLIQIATVSGADALSGLASLNVSVTSSQTSDDANEPDLVVTGSGLQPRTIQIRAKIRNGAASRTFTINSTAIDAAGNPVNANSTCTIIKSH
jgi:hypothetical protein